MLPTKKYEVKLIQVNLQHQALGDLERYQTLFQCPVKFGQESNEVILSRDVLALPVRSADPRLFKMYLRKIERMKNCRQADLKIHQKVFSFVSDHMGQDIPGIDYAANYFNMSISTLKNHLRQEGYNYSNIIDQVRKSRAVKLVNSKSVQLKEIACELGFANPAAFSRAFKRWTDTTPAEYRRAVLEGA